MSADQLQQLNESMRRAASALGEHLAAALRAAAPLLLRAHEQALAGLTPAQQQQLAQELAEGAAQ